MLLTLRGMSGAQALLLIRAGLGTFAAIAETPPEALVDRFEAEKGRAPAIEAPTPEAATVRLWRRAARQYLGLEDGAEDEAERDDGPG